MKKKTVILLVLCGVILMLGIAGCIVWQKLPQPLNYPISTIEPAYSGEQTISVTEETADSVTLQKNNTLPFKILMFTDMHLDGNNKTSNTTVDRMVKSIQQEKPDLVLLGGDNVTSGNNRKRAAQLAEIFEQLGIYWGGVLGNHEGDNKYSITRTEMVDIFSSYDHCIMRKGPDDVDGDCNYVIRLKNADGSLAHAIFCLDTFDEIDDSIRAAHTIFEEKSPYDGAHENQVAWYSKKAAELKKENKDCKSILLLHIPLPAYDKAVETSPLLYGVQNEGICSTCYENGLFEAIKKGGITQTVFCGHDHVNNFGVSYQGITLSYIESSGYGSYGMKKRGAPESEWLQGYTRLDILPDGTYSHTQIRYYDSFKTE